jgi:uncharacterized protein involved in exopolysaccharide biosynthesis
MNLRDATMALVRRRRLLLGLTLGAAILGFALSFLIAPRYLATTKMVVVQHHGPAPLRKLGDMAGFLGFDLSRDGDSLDLYAEYLQSRDLLARLVREPVPDGEGGSTTLRERWGGEGSEAETLKEAIDRLEDRLRIRTRPAAGVLEVAVETFDPSVSAQLAERLVSELNDFNAELRQWSGRNREASLQVRLEEVTRDLRAAEDSLTAFRMENLAIAHPRLRLQEMRLLREVTIQSEILQTIRVQQEMARLEASGGEPVLKVLQTATAPVERSWPRRGRIAFVAALAALVVATYLILAGQVLREPSGGR